MATKISTLLVLYSLMAVVLVAKAAAADKGPAICNVGVSELAECLPAISGSPPSWPTKKCCKVMHKVNLPCLCNYKDKFLDYGINARNAMALPKKCGLKLPVECQDKF